MNRFLNAIGIEVIENEPEQPPPPSSHPDVPLTQLSQHSQNLQSETTDNTPAQADNSASSNLPVPAVITDTEPWLTLLKIRECFVYVPKQTEYGNHYCEKWGLDKPIWTGEIHVIAHEDWLKLRFLEWQTHTLFADSIALNCKLANNPSHLQHSTHTYIEPCRDSSRYFIVRVQDPTTGTITRLGIGFRERPSAFDLNACIHDRVRQVQRHMELEDTVASARAAGDEKEEERRALERLELAGHDERITGIRAGERITVTLKGMQGSHKHSNSIQQRRKLSGSGAAAVGGIGTGSPSLQQFRLAPPPSHLSPELGPTSSPTDRYVPDFELDDKTEDKGTTGQGADTEEFGGFVSSSGGQ